MQNKKEEMINLREIGLRYLREWKWFALSIFCCIAIGFVYIKFLTPVYQINANVLIKDDEKSGLGSSSILKSLSIGGLQNSIDVQDEIHIISSFSLIREAVKELELYTVFVERQYWIKQTEKYKTSPFNVNCSIGQLDSLDTYLRFNLKVASDGIAEVVVSDYSGWETEVEGKLPLVVNTNYGKFVLETNQRFKVGEKYNYIIHVGGLDLVAEDLRKRLNISLADKKSNAINLSIQDASIVKGKDILNRIITLYNKDALTEKNMTAINTAVFIEDRLSLLITELSQIEREVEQYKKSKKLFDVNTESGLLLKQNAELDAQLLEVNTQQAIVAQILEYVADPKNQYNLIPMSLGISDASSVAAIQEYNNALLNRMKVVASSTNKNPVLEIINQQLASLRSNVIQSIANVAQGIAISSKELVKKQNNFFTRYNEAPTIEKEFIDIKRRQTIKEQLVLFLMEKKEENALTLAVAVPKAKIIDNAFKLSKPVTIAKKSVLMIALIIGLLLPLVVIYLFDRFKVTFFSKSELENITLLPVIGEVCRNESGSSEVVSSNAITSISELFRLIRTNISFLLTRKEEKVILITSTQSGEGKSFCAINIAKTFGLMKKKVVLVGLDIRKPMLSEYLHINGNKLGVTNYLSQEDLHINDIISTQKDGIDIILSGPVPPNPGELIVHERMKELFNTLRDKYDYVIVDSAPVGMVSDSFSLSQLSDLTLYITRANYTTRDNIRFAENLSVEGKLKKMYLIINGTTVTSIGGKYGYGYGYTKDKV